MLSYRHAFHAGNHADVLKHLVLVQIARHLGQKDAPFWYVDTHAGAGRYALEGAHAAKLAEFQTGIGKLWLRRDLPPAVAEYVELVQALNPDGKLRHYPGSPWFAWKTLRPQDRLRLFELHSTDSRLLNETFKGAGRQVTITAGDGIAGLKAVLPPPPRRALILIDPSYEVKSDYVDVRNGLQDALKRFATGTYAVWYPQLTKPESRQLPERLKSLPAKNWLHVSLSVTKPPKDGFGMYGSGMFVINPPWKLADTLQDVMPWLVEVLGQEGAKFTVESQGD
ncbi:MAG: 23S rRNA (adenine(2030)-N(6))-methyltransferase RlmJ [Actinomycetota bacterium]